MHAQGSTEDKGSTGLGVQGYHTQRWHSLHFTPSGAQMISTVPSGSLKSVTSTMKGSHTKEGFQEKQSLGTLQALSQGEAQ